VFEEEITEKLLLWSRNTVAGIPDLHIVPMDPLNIPRLEYKEDNENLEMKQVLSNVTMHGIGDSKVSGVRWVASTAY
jgi:hypothetical protein